MSASDCCSDPSPQGCFPGTLYVFLHGLIGVSNNESGVELLIPNVGSDHAYRFGEFLGEVTLPPSPAPYHVTGIQGGNKITLFPPNEHLCTQQATDECTDAPLYARIKLPPPLRVHSYLTVDLTDVIEDPCPHLYRDAKGKITGTLTPVLEYHFRDPRVVLFGGDPLNVAPIYSPKNPGWYMNLHIISEEDLEQPEDHTIGGFDAIAQLFDFESTPRLVSVSNIPPAKKGTLPPGTTHLEFLSLALRTREQGYLGRRVRDQLLSDYDPAIVQVSSVGSSPITCLPLISQDTKTGGTSNA
jgi:hypothetical protein